MIPAKDFSCTGSCERLPAARWRLRRAACLPSKRHRWGPGLSRLAGFRCPSPEFGSWRGSKHGKQLTDCGVHGWFNLYFKKLLRSKHRADQGAGAGCLRQWWRLVMTHECCFQVQEENTERWYFFFFFNITERKQSTVNQQSHLESATRKSNIEQQAMAREHNL